MDLSVGVYSIQNQHVRFVMSQKQKEGRQAILSGSSILIVSGFLIGLTVGKFVAADISPYVLACGLSGFLAFLAFDQAAVRRKVEEAESEQRSMEHRLDRHVHSLSSTGFSMSTDATEATVEEAELCEV